MLLDLFLPGSNESYEKEKEMKKKGGITVPPHAEELISEEIDWAFKDASKRLAKHKMELDPLFLEELDKFRARLKDVYSWKVQEIRQDTKSYKVVTKKDAIDRMTSLGKESFEFIDRMQKGYNFIKMQGSYLIFEGIRGDILFLTQRLIMNNWKPRIREEE